MKSKIIVVVSICALIALAAVALPRPKAISQLPTYSTQLAWTKQTNDIVLADNRLRVRFDAAFAGARWRVGAHIANVAKVSVSVALLSLKSDGGVPYMKQMEAVSNWPESRIQAEAGIIEYLGAPPSDDIVVYVVMPAGAKLQLEAGAQTLFASPISRDLLIDSSGATEKPMNNMSALLVRTLIAPIDDQPRIKTSQSGVNLVNTAALKANLRESVRPSFPTGTQIDKPEEIIIKGAVDIHGKVVKATVFRGDPAFAEKCLTALKGWKFDPFVVNGAQAEVAAIFFFAFDTNGRVIVPALGDQN